MHDEDTGDFFDPEGRRSVEDIWADRAVAIAGFLRMPYHAIVVEFFPFGRRRFKHEITGLFKTVGQACGPVPVFTSVREVLVRRAVEAERAAWSSRSRSTFTRCSSAVIRRSCTSARPFRSRTRSKTSCATPGYISPPLPSSRPKRKCQVLVSQGGGDVGRELLQAAIGALPR